MSDSDRKAEDKTVDEINEIVEKMLLDGMNYEYIYLAIYNLGRSSALKELEQVAREAFEIGWWYGNVGIMDSSRAFQDYWQQKTESKEADD